MFINEDFDFNSYNDDRDMSSQVNEILFDGFKNDYFLPFVTMGRYRQTHKDFYISTFDKYSPEQILVLPYNMIFGGENVLQKILPFLLSSSVKQIYVLEDTMMSDAANPLYIYDFSYMNNEQQEVELNFKTLYQYHLMLSKCKYAYFDFLFRIEDNATNNKQVYLQLEQHKNINKLGLQLAMDSDIPIKPLTNDDKKYIKDIINLVDKNKKNYLLHHSIVKLILKYFQLIFPKKKLPAVYQDDLKIPDRLYTYAFFDKLVKHYKL